MSHDNKGKATATIDLPESLFEGNQNDLPSVIHPASLDGWFFLLSLGEEQSKS